MNTFHRLVVLDTETGGLDPVEHSLIEVAARVVDLNHLAQHVHVHDLHFESKVAPRLPVSKGAAAVNGYTAVRWRAAPSLGRFSEMFSRWLAHIDAPPDGSLVWAGSNVGFDLGFLKSDLRQVGAELPGKPKFSRRLLNTESLCFPLLLRGTVSSLGVAALRKWAGLKGEQKHTALDDVNDTVAIICKYVREEVWR